MTAGYPSCACWLGVLACTQFLSVAASPDGSVSPCSECESVEAKALWWPKTGLNCPTAGPVSGVKCDICTSTSNAAVCATAKTAAECCALCTLWNSDALPGSAKTMDKKCDVWYFNGEACLLKEGGGFEKTAYDPVAGDSYISGPGCHVASGWGWAVIIILGVVSSLYVGGGIGFGVKTQGASVGISAHPHLGQWKQAVGLVVDGVIFTRAHVEAKIRGEAAALAPTVTVEKKQDSTGKTVAGDKTQEATDDGDGETIGLLTTHKETYGAAGTSVDSAATAADEGNIPPTMIAAASDDTSSDDDLVE